MKVLKVNGIGRVGQCSNRDTLVTDVRRPVYQSYTIAACKGMERGAAGKIVATNDFDPRAINSRIGFSSSSGTSDSRQPSVGVADGRRGGGPANEAGDSNQTIESVSQYRHDGPATASTVGRMHLE
jgi:hypothetical protein